MGHVIRRKTTAFSPRRVRVAAYHEAGHAVVALACGLPLEEVRVARSPEEMEARPNVRGAAIESAGQTIVGEHQAVRLTEGTYTLAGPIAHARYSRRSLLSIYMGPGTGDLRAVAAFTNADQHDTCEQFARTLVAASWPAIERVARELVKRGRLTGRQVARLMKVGRAPG